jgi:hypothetical protein
MTVCGSRRRCIGRLAAAVLVGLLALPAGGAAGAVTESVVTVASPDGPFPRNKQNEPAVAVDPVATNVLAAGANDEIDLAPCAGNECPFTPGVGVSGLYLSFDSGATWSQPTYQGFSARNGTPAAGPIGTVPNYYEHGLVADGDPSVAFGPRPDAGGRFAWANGSRLYYASLTSSFSSEPAGQAFPGAEAIALSHADDLTAAAAGNASAWSAPVIVSLERQRDDTFSDKETVWVDNAASSPHFGTVFVCWVAFRTVPYATSLPVYVSRSTDGGQTFSRPRQVAQANAKSPGVQGCVMRTDSRGRFFLFLIGALRAGDPVAQILIRSNDGGRTFTHPRSVATINEVGVLDPVQSDFTFDGVAGARTWSAPTIDVANGAPTGADATDALVLGWSDAGDGTGPEQALVTVSSDGGDTWTPPVNLAEAGDRTDFPALGVAPNGQDVYLVYNAFLDPFRTSLSDPRRMQVVLRHADLGPGGAVSNPATLHRGAVGDARGSSANALTDEFLGDYNYVAATRAGAAAVAVDARGAAVCPAINAFRQSLVTPPSIAAPAPASDCPATFGNTDIVTIATDDPTPGAAARRAPGGQLLPVAPAATAPAARDRRDRPPGPRVAR